MNILETIVEHKKQELSLRMKERTLADFRSMEAFGRVPVSMRKTFLSYGGISVIAEFKRASPSAGSFGAHLCPATVAKAYEENGAAAVSVLTDRRYFSGSPEDMLEVRSATKLPVLRKDFIIHEFQVFEAKAFGADAILLIAAVLSRSQLDQLFSAASSLGLDVLIEIHEKSELDSLDLSRMTLVGINNRNLKTMTVDLKTSFDLAKELPAEVCLVSESGIRSGKDLRALLKAGYKAALIGERFMSAGLPGSALKELIDEAKFETAG